MLDHPVKKSLRHIRENIPVSHSFKEEWNMILSRYTNAFDYCANKSMKKSNADSSLARNSGKGLKNTFLTEMHDWF